jgi:hypothetical protein
MAHVSCWHHQAINETGWTTAEMFKALGPSFQHGRREFERRYGDEKEVLVRLQDWVNSRSDWDYHELHSKWTELRGAN